MPLLIACVLGLLCWFSSPAHAAQCNGSGPELKEPAVCTHLFEFSGTCGVPNFKFEGWPDVAFAVGDWERWPIRILRASADATVRTKWRAISAKIFMGNSYNADPVTPYTHAAGGIMDLHGDAIVTLHTEQSFPANDGMQFAPGPWERIHLDVHLQCLPVGATYDGSMFVEYKLDPPPQEAKQ